MSIINLTQHDATSEQKQAGVVEPEPKDKALIKSLITFEEIPDRLELLHRAEDVADIAMVYGTKKAMIGGASYFMASLENVLMTYNIQPVYSFTKREATEEVQADGSIKSTYIFRHLGFVEV